MFQFLLFVVVELIMCVVLLSCYSPCILSLLCRYTAFSCFSICRVCLWMSEERGDSTYKQRKGQRTSNTAAQHVKRPVRSTRVDKDYSEIIHVSDTEEEKEGAVDLGRGNCIINEEFESPESCLGLSSETWTPNTFRDRTDHLIQGISDFRQQTRLFEMAKESQTSMADVLQLMLKMRADDRAAEEKKEQERERREELIRQDRERRDEDVRREAERREERLLTALKEAQPVVPQTVTIVNQKLPDMKEEEEIETFIGMFEAALRASRVPRRSVVCKASCTFKSQYKTQNSGHHTEF